MIPPSASLPLLLVLGGLAAPAPSQVREPGAFRLLAWAGTGLQTREGAAGLLAELGFDGVNLVPGVPRPSGLAGYVDALLPRGILHVEAETFQEALARGLVEPPDLRRPTGLDEPGVRRRVHAVVRERLGPLAGSPPLFVSFGDEISYTRLINPADWCHRPSSLAGFPRFVLQRWGGEKGVRAAWGPGSGRSTGLVPMTTPEARRRFYRHDRDRRPDALVPWNDARAWADRSLTRFLRWLRLQVEETLPGVPAGFLGGQMPSAFGGFDWSRLLEVADVVEAYDYGGARALVASLARPRTLRFTTVFSDPATTTDLQLVHALYDAFFAGESGVIVFRASELIDGDPPEPTARARLLAPHFRFLRSEAATRFHAAEPLPPRVAILHGMPSVRLHWMLDSREDGASWPRRLTSYERTHSTQGRNRESWIALLHDLGLDAVFVTPEHLAEGFLETGGVGVLVLPRAIAMQDDVVHAVRRFVRGGGLAIADAQLALFTGRLEERACGALDGTFGIDRSEARVNLRGGRVLRQPPPGTPFPVAEPGLRVDGGVARHRAGEQPLFVAARSGEGSTLYLNLLVFDYAARRLGSPDAASRLRDRLRPHLLHAGTRPRVHVEHDAEQPPWPVRAVVRRSGDAFVVGVHVDLRAGHTPVDWSAVEERPVVAVTAQLWGAFHVRDLRTGRDLGRRRSVPLELAPDRPALLELRRTSHPPR